MIDIAHLFWIIPVSASFGFMAALFIMACREVNKK